MLLCSTKHPVPAAAPLHPSHPYCQIIAFVSGKGGVGKTNVALNLGIDLARRGLRSVLLDADFTLANADLLLNLPPNSADSPPLASFDGICPSLARGPEGLQVVRSDASRCRGAGIEAAFAVQSLKRLRSVADIVLVDCGAGVGEPLIELACAADHVIVTTTPEPTALTDAYATLKILQSRGVSARTSVVINMAQSEREASAAARRLTQAAAHFLGLQIEDIGHVPFDRHVGAAVRSRVPFAVQYPLCPASVSINEISARLMGRTGRSSELSGLWARIAGLFL